MRRTLILIALWACLALPSCHQTEIGFLNTEFAGYAPDSLIIKSKLDTAYTVIDNPIYKVLLSIGYTEQFLNANGIFPTQKEFSNQDDYNRHKFKTPWTTTPIQGLKGTAPIKVSVKSIYPESPDARRLKEIIEIRGSSGVLTIPADHGIAPGTYNISLNFKNEGWNQDRDNIFKIIFE